MSTTKNDISNNLSNLSQQEGQLSECLENQLTSANAANELQDAPVTDVVVEKDSSTWETKRGKKITPWEWIPTLYLAEGVPYVIVTVLTLIMYKELGVSNTDATLITSWLYLPWVVKPFWCPIIDMYKTKRWWILMCQMLTGLVLAAAGFSLNMDHFVLCSILLFGFIAINSATHDIAADGYYLVALDSHEQSFFVGIRNTFYRIAMIFGQGALIYLAGKLESKTGDKVLAWSITLYLCSAFMIALGMHHHMMLPRSKEDKPHQEENKLAQFMQIFWKFFKKKDIIVALAFILLYRLGEAQLSRICPLFMLASRAEGGLGLSTETLGIVQGTAGTAMLTFGGLLGGWLVSKNGLKSWFWPMLICMNLPNLVYVYMAYMQPDNLVFITCMVSLEQFGYGFGFTAFMLYLILFCTGENQTSNYSICTGFMALGMMIPGSWAGWLEEHIGYFNFFIWVCICTIPSFLIARKVKIDPEFGKGGNDKKN